MGWWVGLPAWSAALAVGVGLAHPVASVAMPTVVARAGACSALGVADDFAVFSGGVFKAAEVGGTTITGRIAARSDVTLDGAFVRPGAGDESWTVISGGRLRAGRTLGLGGAIDGGVHYAGILSAAPDFTIAAPRNHGPPPFSFDSEFLALGLLSDRWSERPQTDGATIAFREGVLTLRGASPGLNVFHVGAADVGGSAANVSGVVVELPEPSASALINVSTDTVLTVAIPQLTVSPAAAADRLIWNLPRATGLNVTGGVWKGLILAPNAVVTGSNHPQLAGQLIARSVPGGEWTLAGTPIAVCPAAVAPQPSLELTALCVDSFGNLAMRLRNTGPEDVAVRWDDLGGSDFGEFVARADRDRFFNVRDGDARSSVRVIAGQTSLSSVAGTSERCAGEITVTKLTRGDAPPGPWTVRLNGADGQLTRAAQLGAGQSVTFHALGGYQPGTARFGQVVGGMVYTVSEPDPRGATATISVNPVEILTGQHETVTVVNRYAGAEAPIYAKQPTLPPGAPPPLSGPDLVGGAPGVPAADLAVTHTVAPRRIGVGGTVRTITRVRNRGAIAAVGTVVRELPQLDARAADRVARVLSISSSAGRCTNHRPLRCELGTLAPGAEVTIRSRARVMVG